MKKNPQLALNQYIIKWYDIQQKCIFRDVVLRAVLSKFGLKDKEAQEAAIRNTKFFRSEPVTIEGYGQAWVFLKRNIVADMVINTQTAEVQTIKEAIQ
jgi:hypothetical protein